MSSFGSIEDAITEVRQKIRARLRERGVPEAELDQRTDKIIQTRLHINVSIEWDADE